MSTSHPHYAIFGWTKGGFLKVVLGFETSGMTSEGLVEMFEDDFADMSAGNFSFMSMGGPLTPSSGKFYSWNKSMPPFPFIYFHIAFFFFSQQVAFSFVSSPALNQKKCKDITYYSVKLRKWIICSQQFTKLVLFLNQNFNLL